MFRLSSTSFAEFVTRNKSIRFFTRFIVIGIALTLFLGSSSGIPEPVRIQQDFTDAFGLTDGKVVLLDIDRTPGKPVVAELAIDGTNYTLDLQPHSIRANGFLLSVQLPDGSYVERQPETSRALRGTLQGIDGSRVVGSMLETGLAAKIVMGDGRIFFIEPLASRIIDRDLEDLHVVYAQSDHKPHDGRCGVEDLAIDRVKDRVRDTAQHQNDYPQGGSPTIQVAELACDTDVQYFNTYGTEAATLARIELIIDIVNDQYESQCGITHVLTAVIIRTAEPDPYTSSNPSTLLDQFRSHWLNNQQSIPRDVAHLFTGRDLNGGVIGIAWTIGAICNDEAYCLSQSDFNGSLGCATDLTAHELGHLWDGSHCSCPSHTMNPFITCANDFNPTFTIPDIIAYRNSLNCLDDQVLLGDVNLDGTVNLLDVDFFIAVLSSGGYQLEADMDQNGVVNLLDVELFIAALSG